MAKEHSNASQAYMPEESIGQEVRQPDVIRNLGHDEDDDDENNSVELSQDYS